MLVIFLTDRTPSTLLVEGSQ
ncbi:rCG28773, isoform CRA_c [Rattus norvegicus]|uniref:RCG28773, isoform CRA_c n=1 Tax=Rattus norvegicus TaxID=10116 RepID=A6HWA8_RAT|nr:rCG28773, isoform CRA_c [Rattus norvegicus]